MNDFYVYMYLREDGTPYYIGKGRGNRAFVKSQNHFPPIVEETLKGRPSLFRGRQHTEETKHKISLALKGKPKQRKPNKNDSEQLWAFVS